MGDLKGSESEAVVAFAEIERLKHLLQLKESEIEKWIQKNRELNFELETSQNNEDLKNISRYQM
jgi:hypothetical protein